MIKYFICLAAILPLLSQADSVRPAGKPNIVIILSDDIGYGDFGCYGSTKISTPNIDALAGAGMRFTHGYATASTCTPTRYALLTGKYAWRQKGTGILSGVAPALITLLPTRLDPSKAVRDHVITQSGVASHPACARAIRAGKWKLLTQQDKRLGDLILGF